MPHRRVLVACLLLLGGLVAGCGADDRFRSGLERFTDETGEKNTVVELPDGDRFSVGSPDGHTVVVQQYDADSDAWSEPLTVHTERKLWTHGILLARAGSTVALTVEYWTQEVLDDDYAPERSVVAVCRDLVCTPAIRPGGGALGLSLAHSGDYALVGQPRSRVAVWEGGDGWTERRLESLGDHAAVELVDDASLLGLTGRRVGAGCVYTLHTTEPRGLEFTEQASTQLVPREATFGCDPVFDNDGTGEETSSERARVWVEAWSGTVDLVRDGDGWVQEPLPVRHDQVPDTDGRETLSPVFAPGPRPVSVLYSPDLRTVYSQTRWQAIERWSKPRVVAETPDGVVCRRGTVTAVRHESYWAEIDCFEAEGDGVEPDLTLALRSWNGFVWVGGLVRDAGRFADTGTGVLVAGDPGIWVDEEDDVHESPLPFPRPDVDALAAGFEWVARIAPEASPDGCEAVLWTAPSPEADAWEEQLSFAVPTVRGRCPVLDADVDGEDRLTVSSRDGGWSTVLRSTGSGWRVVR